MAAQAGWLPTERPAIGVAVPDRKSTTADAERCTSPEPMNERPPPIGVTDRDRRRCGTVHVTGARNGATATASPHRFQWLTTTAGNRGPETAAGGGALPESRNVAT